MFLANAVYVVVAGRHTVHGGWLRRRHHWHHRSWDGLHWSTCCRATQSLRSSLRLHWFVAWLLHNLCLRAVHVDSSPCLLYAHIWFLYTSHKTHTHPFNSPLSKTTQVSRYRNVKPIWILLKQETVAVASAGPYASLHLAADRQPCQHPTTQFIIGRMPFRPPNQQCQSTEGSIT